MIRRPAVSLRLKRFRQKFGIAAPRVVVRTHFPWPLVAAALLAVVIVLLIFQWRQGQAFPGDSSLDALRGQLSAQQQELALLRSTAGTGLNALEIERAAQQQLLARIQDLERENAALKEDIRIFERLIPGRSGGEPLRVETFRIYKEADGRYRYRLILAYQPGNQRGEFRGRYQLRVLFRAPDGVDQVMVPDKQGVAIQLSHFLRRDGVFALPADAQIVNAEVQVFQGATLLTKGVAAL